MFAACCLAAFVSHRAAAQQGPGPESSEDLLKTDEFLFPEPGATERNVAVLAKMIEGSEEPRADLRGLYGIQLLAGQNFAAARQHCSEALSLGPLFEPTYCMALLHFREGRFDDADTMARKAIALRPASVAPYVLLANVRLALKDRDGMVHAIELGQKAVPDRAAFWEWELAKMLEAMGDLDGALQCAGVLARISADDPRVFTQAGDWLKKQGRSQEALHMYRAALSKASWYEPATLSLLETLRSEAAWMELRSAAEGVQDNPQLVQLHGTAAAYEGQARENLLRGEWESLQARHGVRFDDISTLDQIEPALATDVLLEAAHEALRFSFPSAAMPLLRKARQLSPVEPRVAEATGETMLALGDVDSAYPLIEEAAQALPNAHQFLLLARADAGRGRSQQCMEHTAKALEFAPDSVDVLLVRARCARETRDAAAEKGALDQALRTSPDDVSVLHEVAEYHMHQQGGGKDASSALKRIFASEPYDFRVCLKFLVIDEGLKELDYAMSGYPACISAIPPADARGRADAYSKLAALVGRTKNRSAAVAALGRVCRIGMRQACDDLTRLTSSTGKRAEALKAEPYVAPRRGRGVSGELERLGDAGRDFLVLALEAPGFESLTKDERILLYYLSRAAIAGDNLLYVQNHRHALLLRKLFETLFDHRSLLSKEDSAAVHDFLKYVWLNHGNYDHRTGRKILPRLLTREGLERSMRVLDERGVAFSFIPGEGLEEKIAYLDATLFDPDFEPRLTVTEEGRDAVLESAVNLYDPGISTDMIDGLEPADRNALNVRFALQGGKVVVQRFKAGEVGSEYMERIIHFLKLALPYAQEGPQRLSIEELIRYYETGDEQWFRQHSINWLKTHARIDYVNGFVEQLKDPRGVIGNFEGMAAFVADAKQVDALADAAGFFERQMPFADEYKREEVPRPVTNVAFVLSGTGDMGPVPWAGYNLPNYTDIRSTVGAKNVVFVNILTARSGRDRDAMLEEFYLPEQRAPVREWEETTTRWEVYLHEVIGHGSGRPAEGLNDDPRNLIGKAFSSLEEARADLVALYFVGDDKLAELGVFPATKRADVLKAAYLAYFQGFLASYRKFDGDVISQPHMKGRQLIMQYLLKGGDGGTAGDYGLVLVEKDGNFYIDVTDAEKVRAGVGALLARIQAIVSKGDKAGAELLVDGLGTRSDTRIRDNVVARSAKIGLAGQTAFVFPRLEPVVDRKGHVTDVKMYNDEDLTSQQLRYSRLQQGTDLE